MRIMDDPFFEKHERHQDLIAWLRCELQLVDCQPGDRDRLAKAQKRPWVQRMVLKAPVLPTDGDLTPDEEYASRVFDEGQSEEVILVGESSNFRALPMNTMIALHADILDVSGASVAPGDPKPITALNVESVFGTPRKTCGQIVVTKELVGVTGRAESFINSGLRHAEANANNAAILAAIKASTGISISAGGAVADFLQTAYEGFTYSSPESRFFAAVAPDVARRLAGLKGGSGGAAWPDFDAARGGRLGRLRAYVTNALNQGEGMLIDASGFAGNSGGVRFAASKNATVQMSDSPSAGATNMTSMWQVGARVQLAERRYCFEVVRSDSAVLVTDLNVGS
jgi:hypothetical protein